MIWIGNEELHELIWIINEGLLASGTRQMVISYEQPERLVRLFSMCLFVRNGYARFQ